jgi:hypothetical protein
MSARKGEATKKLSSRSLSCMTTSFRAKLTLHLSLLISVVQCRARLLDVKPVDNLTPNINRPNIPWCCWPNHERPVPCGCRRRGVRAKPSIKIAPIALKYYGSHPCVWQVLTTHKLLSVHDSPGFTHFDCRRINPDLKKIWQSSSQISSTYTPGNPNTCRR